MKNIPVSDDMYDQLTRMAEMVFSQDNRSTAKPFFFQVREDVKVYDSGLNGDVMVFFDSDYDGEREFTVENITKYCIENNISVPEHLADWVKWQENDLIELLEGRGLHVSSYSIKHKYSNAFFTEQACRDHINTNKHHYKKPDDYLSHAFRNPEMELIFNFLRGLVKV